MSAKIYIELFHGRRYDEQPDDWGTQGPVFEADAGYVHTTYACEIKFGQETEKILHIAPSADGDLPDCVYYDGIFYGDWSIFIGPVSDRLIPFDATKAEPPKRQGN